MSLRLSPNPQATTITGTFTPRELDARLLARAARAFFDHKVTLYFEVGSQPSTLTGDHLNKAARLVQGGKLDEARGILSQGIGLPPESTNVHHLALFLDDVMQQGELHPGPAGKQTRLANQALTITKSMFVLLRLNADAQAYGGAGAKGVQLEFHRTGTASPGSQSVGRAVGALKPTRLSRSVSARHTHRARQMQAPKEKLDFDKAIQLLLQAYDKGGEDEVGRVFATEKGLEALAVFGVMYEADIKFGMASTAVGSQSDTFIDLIADAIWFQTRERMMHRVSAALRRHLSHLQRLLSNPGQAVQLLAQTDDASPHRSAAELLVESQVLCQDGGDAKRLHRSIEDAIEALKSYLEYVQSDEWETEDFEQTRQAALKELSMDGVDDSSLAMGVLYQPDRDSQRGQPLDQLTSRYCAAGRALLQLTGAVHQGNPLAVILAQPIAALMFGQACRRHFPQGVSRSKHLGQALGL